MMRRTIGLLGVLAAVALLALGVGIAAAAPTDARLQAERCHLYANEPGATSNRNLFASGGRSGCSNQVQVQVFLKKDESYAADTTIDSTGKWTMQGGHLYVSGPCKGGNVGNYYVETRSSDGGIVQSDRVALC